MLLFDNSAAAASEEQKRPCRATKKLLVFRNQRLFCHAAILIMVLFCHAGHVSAFLLPRAAVAVRASSTCYAASKSGGKLIATADEYMKIINQQERPVLCFFTAAWCGPCRLSIPVVKDVMKQYAGTIDVIEICTDDLPNVAETSGVVSIPTIQMYLKGELLDTIVGCVAKTVLARAVDRVLENAGLAELQ
jgi:thioredoxin 1